MSGLVGSKVRVSIESPDKGERELARKVREIALGREITNVTLSRGQLLLELNDGGRLAINCEGGLREVS